MKIYHFCSDLLIHSDAPSSLLTPHPSPPLGLPPLHSSHPGARLPEHFHTDPSIRILQRAGGRDGGVVGAVKIGNGSLGGIMNL